MLNYTVLNLSKSGFFLGGSNSKNLQKNIVPFLFCSRNNFYIIDVLEFLNYSKKLLYLFQKLFLNRTALLMVLESFSLKKKIDSNLSFFFDFLKNFNFKSNSSKDLVLNYYSNISKIEKFLVESSFLKIFSNFYFFYVNNKKSEFNSVFKTKIRKDLNFKYFNFLLNNRDISFQNFLFKKTNFYLYKFLLSKKNLIKNFVFLNFFFKNLKKQNSFREFFWKDSFILFFNKSKFLKSYLFSFFSYSNFLFVRNMDIFNRIFLYQNLFLILKNNYLKIKFEILGLNTTVLNVFKKNTVKGDNLKVLNSFFKKINYKKYNLLLFIDKRVSYIKKWLYFMKKRKKNNSLISLKYSYLLNLLFYLYSFKRKIKIANNILSFNLREKKINSLHLLEDFSMSFRNKYIKESLLFWNGKWLNGTLTNFYGLKKDLKKEVVDFDMLKKIPDFVSLFSLRNNEGFLNEVSTLGIPFSAIADSKMDPFFFHYYLPSNNNNGDILYFIFLLILESFLRGFLKEISNVVR